MDDVVERAAVRVGGVEIPAAAIAAEAQNHPAPDATTAWNEAAEALAIRQLLLAEASDWVSIRTNGWTRRAARLLRMIRELTLCLSGKCACRRHRGRGTALL